MISVETLLAGKEHIEQTAQTLQPEEIGWLVSLLCEKNNEIRYAALLILQKRSEMAGDVYPYWDEFARRLNDENSYQRSIGIMMLAENVKWDQDNRLEGIVDAYLLRCRDEKFITARQTIQSVKKWISYKAALSPVIADFLMDTDLQLFQENQRKLILTDILDALLEIRKIQPSGQIADYIQKALTGGLLDKKTAGRIGKEL